MKKINILFLIDVFFKMAGTERHFFEILTRLDRTKFDPIVVCLHNGSLTHLLEQQGITVVNLNVGRIYSFIALKRFCKIFKLIKRNNIEIMVTYHESSDFVGSLIGILARVPIVISSRRDMGYKLSKNKRRVYRLLNRFFYKIVCVSDAVKNNIFDVESAWWHKLVTVYNGVDLERFLNLPDSNQAKNELGVKNDFPVVGILAALRPIKDHVTFLRAAGRVLHEMPAVNFLVIGWYEDASYYSELKRLVDELKIGDKVIFTEREIDPAKALAALDISVITSHNEGFSNTIIESMAAGKAVIATNTGGTPEAIRNGFSGILFNPGDVSALAEAIIDCLRNKNKREELGNNAKNCARREFSMRTMVKRMELLYESSLEYVKLFREWKSKRRLIYPRGLFFRFAKSMISFVASYCGINLILGKTVFRNKYVILAYHKVNDSLNDPLNMAVSIANFEKHIRFIRNKYRVFSLRDLLSMAREHKKIPYNAVAVTFDDGYEDNYLNAYPILKKYGVPATFFLAVDAIDNKHALWYEVILKVLGSARSKDLDLRGYGRLQRYSLSTPDDLWKAQVEVIFYGKALSVSERERFVETLLERTGLRMDEIAADHVMLTWDNVKQMQNDGYAFESHGLTHTIFSNFPKEELEKEVFESRRIISERTGVTPTVMAFPNGQKDDYGHDTIAVLKKFGYAGACTLESGLNGYEDFFRLKRYCMDNLVGAGFNDRFSGAVFDTTISGIFSWFK